MTFCIGFRHDGLIALQVCRDGQPDSSSSTLMDEVAEENYARGEAFDPEEKMTTHRYADRHSATKQQFTPLGKIDLSMVPKK